MRRCKSSWLGGLFVLCAAASGPGSAISAVPPSDLYLSSQWFLDGALTGGQVPSVGVFPAWSKYTGAPTDRIGFLVHGHIRSDHPDLAGRVTNLVPYTADSNGNLIPIQPTDAATTLGGLAGAQGDNGIGVAGIDWAAQLLTYESIGSANDLNDVVPAALSGLWAHGATTIAFGWELSPGERGASWYQGLDRGFRDAYAREQTVVLPIATDEGAVDGLNLPSRGLGSINVQAVSDAYQGYLPHRMSSAYVDLSVETQVSNVIPTTLLTTSASGGYTTANGNPAATAIVAGAAALLRGYASTLGLSLTTDDIRGILNASTLGRMRWDEVYGYGQPNIGNALAMLGPGYVRRTYTATGYTYVGSPQGQGDNPMYLVSGNAWGLPEGLYRFWPVPVIVSVPKSLPGDFTTVLGVWAQGRASSGHFPVNLQAPHFAEIWRGNYEYSSTVTLRTYVFKVVDAITGRVVDGLYPNPSTLHWEYVTIGTPPPLAATISGPTNLISNQVYTWTANVTGGAGPYAYRWWMALPHPYGESTIDPVGTGPSYTGTYGFNEYSQLRCTVTSGSESVTASLNVYQYDPPMGGGDPGGDPGDDPDPIEGCSRPCFAAGAHTGIHGGVASGRVEIAYSIPRAGKIDVSAYDVLGRRVAHLVDGELAAGRHVASWDTRGLAPGVYLVSLRSGADTARLKLTVMN